MKAEIKHICLKPVPVNQIMAGVKIKTATVEYPQGGKKSCRGFELENKNIAEEVDMKKKNPNSKN